MHFKIVLLLVLVLCQLGKRFLSQLTTAGHMYELIAGQDSDDAASAAARFTAYFDCWQDDNCLYVAKEISSGTFALKKAGETLNNDKYSAVWKKNTVDIDECISSPCRNGTCADRVSGYHCICNPGFNGTHCEIEINECNSNPCVNGQCSDRLNDYQCTCNRGYHGKQCNKKIKSCIDIYTSGTRTNGKFLIFGADDVKLDVYCDFESEANSSWTLVVSYSLENKNLFHFPYYNSKPRNSANLNWNDYRRSQDDVQEVKSRLDKPNMQAIQSQSTLWRITCGFPIYGVDYRDYLRVRNSDFNFMSYDGQGNCYMVEYVNIRGHSCSVCRVPFYQGHDSNVHTDSSKRKCYFNPSVGSVQDEDNFGLYFTFNPAFRCTENEKGTTQVWFGEKF